MLTNLHKERTSCEDEDASSRDACADPGWAQRASKAPGARGKPRLVPRSYLSKGLSLDDI